MVFIVCTAAGLYKSAVLSKRVRQLEAFVGAINLISTEIRYFASPVEDIMQKVNALEEYAQLLVFGICKKNLLKLRDFPKAWEFSLIEAKPKLALNAGDFETLLWFGKLLGTTDLEGQTANCERYGKLLEQRLIHAKDDMLKRGKMYSSLGVLAGVFIIVIFF
jgi:stage III sporulation protein AB